MSEDDDGFSRPLDLVAIAQRAINRLTAWVTDEKASPVILGSILYDLSEEIRSGPSWRHTETFDYVTAQSLYLDAKAEAERAGQPGYGHQDGLAAVFAYAAAAAVRGKGGEQ